MVSASCMNIYMLIYRKVRGPNVHRLTIDHMFMPTYVFDVISVLNSIQFILPINSVR